MKKIVVLGCTGSIGTSTLDIVRNFPDAFQIVGLTAHSQKQELERLSKEFSCNNVALTSTDITGIEKVISESKADLVVNGIAGAAGLYPSVFTLQNKIDLALANKETIVMAGDLIRSLAGKNNCALLPVDSEHSAVFNLISKYGHDSVDSVILTASGGPFRNVPSEELQYKKPSDALKHPTWNMGTKITIDSASLANKGLEVIEACKLFDMSPDKVQVVVHPQSIVHSLIRTKDGVLYAQMSKPDMRHPILSALTWPQFTPNHLEPFDIIATSFENGITLSFFPPRIKDFPMLSLAYDAVKAEGAYTIAYNAANEIAVDAYLHDKINFTDIPLVTEKTLEHDWSKAAVTFDEVFLFDSQARKIASGGIF